MRRCDPPWCSPCRKGHHRRGAQAAIGVYHELSSGQTRVRFKAAQHKGTAGVNKHSCVLIQIFSQRRHKDKLIDNFTQLLLAYLRLVLGGNHYRMNPFGLPVFIFHGHLCLPIRSEPFQQVVPANLGQAHGDPMGQHHGQGQKQGRLRQA